jgi:hypothetical protein
MEGTGRPYTDVEVGIMVSLIGRGSNELSLFGHAAGKEATSGLEPLYEALQASA